MKTALRMLLISALAGAWPAQAHDMQYTVVGGQAVVIKLFYADDTPFSFEAYEIYRAGEQQPYQVGRSDSQGRIAFLPDRAGDWRIKTYSEDGHGLDFRLATDAAALLAGSDKPAFERHSRIFIGVGFILGLFGLLSLYLKRKQKS